MGVDPRTWGVPTDGEMGRGMMVDGDIRQGWDEAWMSGGECPPLTSGGCLLKI